MVVSILKKIGLAVLLIGVILLLANIFRPENASRIGSGFTRIIPAVTYPFKMALFSATIFLISSFTLKPKTWKVVYFVLFAINLVYLIYCIRTYVG
jgi:hypothetical protein